MSKLKLLARSGPALGLMVLWALLAATPASASEADLRLPNLSNPDVPFFGTTGHNLLLGGLVVCRASFGSRLTDRPGSSSIASPMGTAREPMVASRAGGMSSPNVARKD